MFYFQLPNYYPTSLTFFVTLRFFGDGVTNYDSYLLRLWQDRAIGVTARFTPGILDIVPLNSSILQTISLVILSTPPEFSNSPQ